MKKSKLGLCKSSRKKLVWTKYGFLWWAPNCLPTIIIKIYNYFACKIYGHAWIPDGAIREKGGCVYYTHDICCDCGETKQGANW